MREQHQCVRNLLTLPIDQRVLQKIKVEKLGHNLEGDYVCRVWGAQLNHLMQLSQVALEHMALDELFPRE